MLLENLNVEDFISYIELEPDMTLLDKNILTVAFLWKQKNVSEAFIFQIIVFT